MKHDFGVRTARFDMCSSIRMLLERWAVLHTRCFMRDITERRALEIELALREQRLNSFFNAPTAGMFIVDAQFRFIQINQPLAMIHGVPVKQQLGERVSESRLN